MSLILGPSDVIGLHDFAIEQTGGLPGQHLDISLESALARIEQRIAYDDLTD